MEKEVEERELSRDQVRLRTDADGYCPMNTTFGPITFPTFAYRDLSTAAASVTRNPARALLPYRRSCRSSPCAWSGRHDWGCSIHSAAPRR